MYKYILCYYFVTCYVLMSVTCLSSHEFEKQLESYFPCDTDRDCKPNSFCSGNSLEQAGLCVCKPKFVIQRNRTSYDCFKEAEFYEDLCQYDIQCQINFSVLGTCEEGKCKCEHEAHFYNKRCYRTIRLGHICSFSENCLLKDKTVAYCVSGKCSCDDISQAVSDESGDECVVKVNLGGKCKKDVECHVANSTCYGECRCKIGFITNAERTECLQAAYYLDQPCITDDQCEKIEKAVCKNNLCKCRSEFHAHNNVCYKNLKTGDTCTSEDNCGPDDVVACVGGVCKCKDGKNCPNGVVKINIPFLLDIIALIFVFNMS